MRKLTIEAVSLTSARGIEAALHGFEREVVHDDGRYCVNVTLPIGDQGIVGVLDALELYVRERADGPARVSLAGRNYTLDADSRKTQS